MESRGSSEIASVFAIERRRSILMDDGSVRWSSAVGLMMKAVEAGREWERDCDLCVLLVLDGERTAPMGERSCEEPITPTPVLHFSKFSARIFFG